MQTYRQYRPTELDRPGAFLCDGGDDDRSAWLVVPVIRTRDSGPLEESNFGFVRGRLDTAASADDWETHRFGHWGPGWYEIIIVRPGTKAHDEAAEIERRLDGYPVLDEDDLSRREYDSACEGWKHAHKRDRIAALARAGVSIFAARRDEFPDDPDGSILDHFRAE